MRRTLNQTVHLVAILNLSYFGIEFAVALAIGSVSLFADSIDFLEDASVNFLILVALGWSARNRARVGMALAVILLIPGLATLWTAWQKLMLPLPPAPIPLSLTGAGATFPAPIYQKWFGAYQSIGNVQINYLLHRFAQSFGIKPDNIEFLLL